MNKIFTHLPTLWYFLLPQERKGTRRVPYGASSILEGGQQEGTRGGSTAGRVRSKSKKKTYLTEGTLRVLPKGSRRAPSGKGTKELFSKPPLKFLINRVFLNNTYLQFSLPALSPLPFVVGALPSYGTLPQEGHQRYPTGRAECLPFLRCRSIAGRVGKDQRCVN